MGADGWIKQRTFDQVYQTILAEGKNGHENVFGKDETSLIFKLFTI